MKDLTKSAVSKLKKTPKIYTSIEEVRNELRKKGLIKDEPISLDQLKLFPLYPDESTFESKKPIKINHALNK